MESAPQSTINHNAVIEFASDPGCPHARAAGCGGRTKRKPAPAQEGGLKSAGTMPKSSLRRNAAMGESPAFLQGPNTRLRGAKPVGVSRMPRLGSPDISAGHRMAVLYRAGALTSWAQKWL